LTNPGTNTSSSAHSTAGDHVRIRGHHLDLGQLTAVLQDQEGVREAVVLIDQHGPEPVLVAYVVPQRAALNILELKEAILLSLPEYMVPDTFALVENLPFTNADGPPVLPHAVFTEPKTPVERIVADLWAAALGLDRVGSNDDFLDLGGDSLIAAHIVARILERFGREVPLEKLFEGFTVAQLAEAYLLGAVPTEGDSP
jgi:acyl carrier protein